LFLRYQDLLARLETIPGVRSAVMAAVTPIEGGAASRFVQVEGAQPERETRRRVSLNWVSPGYFDTIGTPTLAGRDFTRDDERGPRVAIVNQAFVRHYYGGAGGIGGRFTFDEDKQQYEIVGVVGDAKYSSLHEAPPRTVYLHALQEGRGRFSKFAIRTSVPPSRLVAEVRRTAADAVKGVPVAKITTLADQVDASTEPERLIAVLSGSLASLAAALAAVGLYGLLAYTVARRTNEIGVRIALGATRHDVTVMILRHAFGLVSAGLVIGAPMAVWSQRLTTRLFDDLASGAVLPIAIAAMLMAGVALLAAYIPARRAARIEPMAALRQE
jgi:predicted permease